MSLANDLIAGMHCWHAWTLKAWLDIVLRYRRTLIGPFWMVLTTGLVIACLAIIAPAIFGGGNPDFIPYLGAGVIVWSFIALSLAELTGTFIEHSGEIQTVKNPYSAFVYRIILRNLIVFLHILIIYVVIAIISEKNFITSIPLFLGGVVLSVLNFVWIGFFLGILCARFRDIQQLIMSILTVAFLITPVFWDKSALIGRRWIVDYNPLSHLLEVMRAPLINQVPSAFSYAFLGISLVVGFTLTAYFYKRFMHRVVFWL